MDRRIEITSSNNLEECETLLQERAVGIRLLGEIELREEEVHHIEVLLCKNYDDQDGDLTHLYETPLMIALFLVWKGIREYREGDFWDVVLKGLRLRGLKDGRELFGRVFYRALLSYELREFLVGEDDDKNQILAHGFIPAHHLETFFSTFLYPEFKDLLDGPIDYGHVGERLNKIRENQTTYFSLLERKVRLNLKIREIDASRDCFLLLLENPRLQKKVRLFFERIEDRWGRNSPDFLEALKRIQEEEESLKQEIEKKKNALEKEERRIEGSISWHEMEDKKVAIKAKEEEVEEIKDMIVHLGRSLYPHFKMEDAPLFEKLPLPSIDRALLEDSGIHSGGLLGLWKNVWRYVHKYDHLYRLQRKRGEDLPLSKDSILQGPDPSLYKNMQTLKKLYLSCLCLEDQLEEMKREIALLVREDMEEEERDDFFDYRENLDLDEKKQDLEERRERDEREIEEIEEQKKVLEEVKRLGREVRESFDHLDLEIDIDSLISSLRDRTEEGLKEDLAFYTFQREILERDLKDVEDRLTIHPGSDSPLLESIVIFFSQGKKIAKDFLYELLLLLQGTLFREEEVLVTSLPAYVQEGVETWCQNYFSMIKPTIQAYTRVQDKGYSHVLKDPKYIFSKKIKEILLFFPQQRLELGGFKGGKASLRLLEGERRTLVTAVKLHLQQIAENTYKTSSGQFRLFNPRRDYCCELLLENKVVKSWFLEARSYYLFSREEHIEKDLAKGFLGLVIREDWTPEPEEVVLHREDLSGLWSGFSYLQIDEEKAHLMVLKGREGRIQLLEKHPLIKPKLTGGTPLEAIQVEGVYVYQENPPHLLFSKEDKGLRNGTIKILAGGSIASYSLKELRDVFLENGHLLTLPLKALIHHGYGLYQIIVECKEYKERFAFLLLPKLVIAFSSHLYPSVSERYSWGLASLLLPKGFTFQPTDDNVKSKVSPPYFRIQFPMRRESIKGVLSSSQPSSPWKLPVEISLPRPSWRLLGVTKEWTREEMEFWVGDILAMREALLQVKVPGKKGLQEGSLFFGKKVVTNSPNNGIYTFNLLDFKEYILKSSSGVLPLVFSLEQKGEEEGYSFPLITIRRVWEVQEIQVRHILEGHRRSLWIIWRDKGRRLGRFLRIWRGQEGGKEYTLVLEKSICDEVGVRIEGDREKLPAGLYSLQFAKVKMNMRKEVLPMVESKDTIDCTIGTEEEIIDQMLKSGLRLIGVEDEKEERFEVKESVFIKEIERLKEKDRDKEERYKGDLLFGDSPMGTNPVTFSFHIERDLSLPFLVDADRDGMTYCKECKEIFWDLEDEEHRELHIIPKRILVKINH